MRTAGSTALVTGASGGIGRAVAAALTQAGADVIGLGRNLPALQRLAEACGADVHAVDLASEDALARFITAALPGMPPIDILVNGAGVGGYAALAGQSPSAVHELLAVNARAPLLLTQAVLPGMLARGRGRIVNVGSIAGAVGVRNEAAYGASKAALAGLSRALAVELAGTGVGVTLVTLGAVDTPFFARRGAAYDRRWPRPIHPDQAARALVRAIASDRGAVVVPGWLSIPIWLQAAAPTLYARLARRFG